MLHIWLPKCHGLFFSFICDTIVVKALEDIAQNQEIFNCYGIDYRMMTREERQSACKKRYYFECKCTICANPERELVRIWL